MGVSHGADMPEIKEAETVTRATPAASQNSSSSSNTPGDTWRDHRWLELHATALYPLIRGMLRDELLRDRERRGKMMREY
jgi:hypothetical protein